MSGQNPYYCFDKKKAQKVDFFKNDIIPCYQYNLLLFPWIMWLNLPNDFDKNK
jgi:hypothetical protein